MSSIKKNITYQMGYQVIILVIPLIISPYLANTLGADAVGIYSFAYSVAYLFFVFGRLGVVEYGTREIASCQGDPQRMQERVWSVFVTHGILALLCIVAYCIFVCFFCKENKTVFWTQFLFVASTLLDFTWVYFGSNKFKSLIMRNVFVKILELLLILLLVKSEDDLVLYSIIMSASYLMGNIVVVPYIVKTFRFVMPSKQQILRTVKPLLVLSVSVIALNIYQTIDKVLLGLMTNKTNVGFYEYSEKLVKVPVHIINSISTVMLPTMTLLIKNKETEKARESFESTLTLLSFLAFAFGFGMVSVSDYFIPLYYNQDFIVCAKYLAELTPLIFLLTFNNTLRAQYLLPYHRDKEYVISLVMATIVNLLSSLILIPIIGVEGAIVGTIIGEATATIFEVIIVKQYVSIVRSIKCILPYCFIGLSMLAVLELAKKPFSVSWLHLLLLVGIGGIFYLFVSLIYMFVFNKPMLVSLKKAFVKNKRSRE